MNPGYSKVIHEIAVDRVLDGESIPKVAASVGVHKSTLYGWVKAERNKQARAADVSAVSMLQDREREIDGLHTQVRELKSLVRDLLGLVKMCDRDNIPHLDERIRELGIEGGSE